ncbi:hypothetical protein M2459_003259 [Parabacteroides sp. PF5-5]|uniref:DUF3575 domain-containing protein n=1 Tax=unclassified Parabacteroides TaxID=2649774 RepID=UPI002475A1ED|nr:MULTISPECIES: DUF3575 domain-containing protein [unclassified Parabacteroides]MDH6306485.1 hypothetical protein [Parabacteroides sp. PH5-39]MDH6317452.1 hypothetical protein [Parabacteroides sp. PF5-13]MDH6321245.1 hypothetical protein [Parabacteroides sp. PH5-13]MDH6324977.1 hypothetical protein [Parabacteroides sp. PH5-8]MDH6328686.1 hypothetical protein [Parabacteroides sp. PH5-41]
MRVGIICLALVVSLTNKLSAQENPTLLSTQNIQLIGNKTVQVPHIINPPSSVALKINLLYAATLTPNLALEIGLSKKTSLELGGGYNFYDPDNQKHWKHWLVQPEFRYWFCERFNGSYLGVHALGGEYNFSKINLPLSVFDDLDENRYEGHFYGGGLVFGHQWILSKRWNFELSLGAGYVRVHYDKYPCASCGGSIENGVKNYFGPTKATISFLLFL